VLTVTQYDSFLREVPLFAAIPAGDLAALAAGLPQLHFAAGRILFHEGDPGSHFYIIRTGEIEIIKALGSDDERLLSRRGPGEFVGEMSLLNDDGLRTASVRCVTPVQALKLSRADFDALLLRHPQMAYEMLRVLSDRLRASHDASIRDLHEKNQRLSHAYAELQAAQAQLIAQETLLRELQLARETQQSMLPATLPAIAGVSVGAHMQPARMVGGDFYDVIRLDADRLGIAIGDVAGKGMPAALFMALTSSLLRAEVLRGSRPADALRMLNRHLLSRNTQHYFVTLLYGEFHRSSGEFQYVRAGHEYPLAWDAGGRFLDYDRDVGHPLGIFLDSQLDAQTLVLPPGGTLLLYTDGVVEAFDTRNEPFGHERLLAACTAATGRSAQQICDTIVQQVAEYAGDAAQSDDITLVAIRYSA
jgi:sigma-B regulation protein RsbU (phosphoserine phosphatase)